MIGSGVSRVLWVYLPKVRALSKPPAFATACFGQHVGGLLLALPFVMGALAPPTFAPKDTIVQSRILPSCPLISAWLPFRRTVSKEE